MGTTYIASFIVDMLQGFSKIENGDVWSCCLSAKFDSKGCSSTSYDPNKIDFEAITM